MAYDDERQRRDEAPIPESPVEAGTTADAEGLDGLQYVTGVEPYHSLDDILKEEEERAFEERAAEDRMEQDARERVARAKREAPILAQGEDVDEIQGEPGDVLDDPQGPEVVSLDDLETQVAPRYAQDADVQGRDGEPERDWYGDAWADTDPLRARLNDGSKRGPRRG